MLSVRLVAWLCGGVAVMKVRPVLLLLFFVTTVTDELDFVVTREE